MIPLTALSVMPPIPYSMRYLMKEYADASEATEDMNRLAEESWRVVSTAVCNDSDGRTVYVTYDNLNL